MDIEIAPGAASGSQRRESSLPFPHQSLQLGQWVKLICGASYQDMPTIRRLVMIYALAGVDCLDVALDGAVVAAARQGLEDAIRLAGYLGNRSHLIPGLPWLMVSLNDSEDPHFRKAHFDAAHCPPECDRPCEPICPTAAIQFQAPAQGNVASDLCYGCGRCIAVCPIGNIEAQPYLASPESFSIEQLSPIDAVEIHTQTGHQAQFAQLWQRLQPWRPYLKLVSISCPDHDQVVPYLWDLYHLMAPLEVPLIWQTDGRPMSGDLGKGTTHATIRLTQKMLEAGPPGYVQPAGGTNGYTVDKLLNLGLVNPALPPFQPSAPQGEARSSLWSAGVVNPDLALAPQTIAGIAYGSYARSQVLPLLDAVDQEIQSWLGNDSLDQPFDGQSDLSQTGARLSKSPPWQRLDSSALGQCLALARQLVGPLKSHRHFLPTRYG
ncbi:MAG: 4Fe-4S ferredoxin [Tildeniella torsiva UHER 1998/13D]|jgi:Fe-S-cluster-containing hydrogenase component 2|nr:4Fe-4S ferredoxin [Tildeniella torsiva UHER 1998/13D]